MGSRTECRRIEHRSPVCVGRPAVHRLSAIEEYKSSPGTNISLNRGADGSAAGSGNVGLQVHGLAGQGSQWSCGEYSLRRKNLPVNGMWLID